MSNTRKLLEKITHQNAIIKKLEGICMDMEDQFVMQQNCLFSILHSMGPKLSFEIEEFETILKNKSFKIQSEMDDKTFKLCIELVDTEPQEEKPSSVIITP